MAFENGRNSNFQGLVTLTLNPAIRHTVVHHSSTYTYIPNFIQIEETFCGRTYGRTDGRKDVRTDIFPPSNIIRSTFGSRPKKRNSTVADDDDNDGDFPTAAELFDSSEHDRILARPIFGDVTPHLLQQATGSCIHDSSSSSRDHSATTRNHYATTRDHYAPT